MDRQLRVAVVGCGTAGAAAALLLHRAGHDVVLLERAVDPGPVGAGILLQRLGQEVLTRMGLAAPVRDRSPDVSAVDARTVGGRPVMQFSYDDLPGAVAGWGVARGTLFATLLEAARAEGVRVVTGATVTAVHRDRLGHVVRAAQVDGDATVEVDHLDLDLVVGADGSSSTVRGVTGLGRGERTYPYGALWAVVDDPDGLAGHTLSQRYDGTRHTFGVLPTGHGRASIFWSLPERAVDGVLAAGPAGVEAWRREARRFAGPHEPLLDAVTTVLPARYRHVRPTATVRRHRMRDAGVVLVGDAAHGMSPQLGTGASLALADAWTLAVMVDRHPTVDAALTAHQLARAAHIRWYSAVTRAMTPLFQSDLVPLGPPRDLLVGAVTHVPLVQRIMVGLLMGAQTSPVTSWRLPDA